MNEKSFKLLVKERFNLSTGGIAFVGVMEPTDYPIILPDRYIVEIRSSSGKNYQFSKIAEDLFSRKDFQAKIKFRSLQTFDDMSDFFAETNGEDLIIYGFEK